MKLLVLPALLLPLLVKAQTDRVVENNQNLWFSHWGDHHVAEKWSVHSEFHIRRADMGASPQQLLIRPAVNFHLNDMVKFTLGYSYYENYGFGEFPIRFNNWEHHIYEQVQTTHRLGKLVMAHRFRMEHRWVAQIVPDPSGGDGGVFDGYSTSNRMRYRLWNTYPLNPNGKLTGNAYWELFLVTRAPSGVDRWNQNRLAVMLGYRFTKELNVLVGYLQQNLQRAGAANGVDLDQRNGTLHIAAVLNLDFRGKTLDYVPQD
ncbi:MAG: DUF2490 domain-containing protein [Flavobacteriales bacterium]|nr:DUF2490 domain-containing protein [Flavobacteriales bacterium]